MSSNRLIYDTCAYKKKLDQSVGPLSYILNPLKYENCNKCRHELGIVGGTNVSNIKGNLVDLENDLRGQTRQATLCPNNKFTPGNGGIINNQINLAGSSCQKGTVIDTSLVHLPPCQMIRYRPTSLPDPIEHQTCPQPKLTAQNAVINARANPNCRF